MSPTKPSRTIDRIDALLKAKGISSSDLSRRCEAILRRGQFPDLGDLSKNRFTKWRKEGGEPSLRQAEVIAQAIGVSLYQLTSQADPGHLSHVSEADQIRNDLYEQLARAAAATRRLEQAARVLAERARQKDNAADHDARDPIPIGVRPVKLGRPPKKRRNPGSDSA